MRKFPMAVELRNTLFRLCLDLMRYNAKMRGNTA